MRVPCSAVLRRRGDGLRQAVQRGGGGYDQMVKTVWGYD